MKIACLLLAAGAGRRFGGCKQLTIIGGKPMVRHSLETLAPIFAKELYIVLGAHREEVRPVVEDLAQVIDHKDWQQGLGSSITHGIRRIEVLRNYNGILVALADQPRLTDRDYKLLVDRFDGDRVVAAYYADRPGVPAIFPAALFENLRQLEGDRGAKSMLMEMKQEIVTVDLPTAEIDIDTLADVAV